jgi:GMP synthase-like glutamine amidotransferase
MFANADFAVDYRWAYHDNFPKDLDGYDGIYFSESPHGANDDVQFIQRERELIREAASRRIPMLGICFGAQILASALYGLDRVFRRSSCEVGYTWLTIQEEAAVDPVLKDLGRRLRLFVWHNDDVQADHDSMTIYGKSDICPNHLWRSRDLPVWGIQGHPEVTMANAHQWFEENRKLLEKDGADVDGLVRNAEDTSPAATTFTNFIEVCRDYGRGMREVNSN